MSFYSEDVNSKVDIRQPEELTIAWESQSTESHGKSWSVRGG